MQVPHIQQLVWIPISLPDIEVPEQIHSIFEEQVGGTAF